MTDAQKQQIADADQRRAEAHHMSVSYGLRADQLTNWKRFLDFVSLGVAPGILLIVIDKPYVREIGLFVAGLCSSAAYIWAIFSLTYKWDRQLEMSRKASSVARELSVQLKKLLAEARDSTTPEERRQQLLGSAERVVDQFWQLNREIDEATVAVKPWMTLMAQQQTMLEVATSCGACGQYWDKNKHRPLTGTEAKRFKPHADDCPSCGLSKQNIPTGGQR